MKRWVWCNSVGMDLLDGLRREYISTLRVSEIVLHFLPNKAVNLHFYCSMAIKKQRGWPFMFMCSLFSSPLSSWSCSPAACFCQTIASPPPAPSSVGIFLVRSVAGTTTRPPCPGPWWSACHKSASSVPDTSTWSLCRSFPLWSPSPS